MNNILIFGASGVGKTTLCNKLKDVIGMDVYSLSKPLKENYPMMDNETYNDYVIRLSNITEDILKNNPSYFVDKIPQNIPLIIDGLRNPNDFISVYKKGDYVFDINCERVKYSSEFEELGIEAIRSYCKFSKIYNDMNYTAFNSLYVDDNYTEYLIENITSIIKQKAY